MSELDERRILRREAMILALRIVKARHLPENPTAHDLDESDAAIEQFWGEQVINDPRLYHEVSYLEAVLRQYGDRVCARLRSDDWLEKAAEEIARQVIQTPELVSGMKAALLDCLRKHRGTE